MLVFLYATLRQAAGTNNAEVAVDGGTTLEQALRQLVSRYPAIGPVLLDGNGRVQQHVRIFLNGRDTVDVDEALRLTLNNEDRLDIFPAIAGGNGGPGSVAILL